MVLGDLARAGADEGLEGLGGLDLSLCKCVRECVCVCVCVYPTYKTPPTFKVYKTR